MTIIAWDGKTMAADKYAWSGGLVGKITKIRKINGNLVGISGAAILLPTVFRWAESEFSKDLMPPLQKDPKDYAAIMVIAPDRQIWIYENELVPWLNERPYWAIGLGREVAIGAMAEKATAVRAVQHATEWSGMCGQGIDTLTFDEEL